jgi:hypothetical protein
MGRQAMEHLPLVEAPASIWGSLESALESRGARRAVPVTRWRWAFAAIALVAVIAAAYWRFAWRSGMQWEVQRLEGSPLVGANPVEGSARIGAGEWIETDSASRAAVAVGAIGSVEIEPNTRLRVVAARPGEQRLALARGEIRARISAPPRLFIVDTAAGTAVDLGCEYALSTAEDGSSLLHVTRGWVSFEWKGLESLVPAGASCRTHPYAGPGIPYFDDATESLKQAAANFGWEKSGGESLEVILHNSRMRDTLTLWHLLARVQGRDRERVFDRIAALTPVPADVSRELVLKLDRDTLARWKDALAWTW